MSPAKRIIIVPLGSLAANCLERLREMISTLTSFPVDFGPSLPPPLPAFNPVKRKFYSHFLIEYLRQRLPQGDILIGLADVDIYSESRENILSEVQYLQQAGIISLSQLKEFLFGERPEALLCERLAKEALHILGHLSGLGHCPHLRCVMYPSRGVMETDYKQLGFCPECSLKLRLTTIMPVALRRAV
ncbi:hypothetical protein [Thermosulfuriphilus sp.]